MGLVLYDGESITTFEHDVSDPDSIAGNYVRTIFEDSRGRLWIGMNASGLEWLDRSTWSFRHHRHDSGDDTTISHDSVNVITETADGSLWIGTQIGLNRFDPVTETFERFRADPEDPESLANDYVYALCEDSEGFLWVATVGGGLDRLDRLSGTFTHHRHAPDDPTSFADDRIFALAEDDGGALWVGTQAGLYRLGPDRDAFEHFAALGDGDDDRAGLSYPLVTSLELDAAGHLWVGTWGGGVDVLETTSMRFVDSMSRAVAQPSRIRASALAVDSSDAVWIGTWTQGVFRARAPEASTALITSQDGLAFEDATSVLEDRKGNLWVGTWGFGLSLRRAGERRFEEGFRDLVEPLSRGSVIALHEAAEDEVWAGTMGPLFRIGSEGVLSAHPHDPSDEATIGPGYVTAIHVDSDGRLWVGVGGSGLYRRYEDRPGFEAFVHDPENPRSLSDDYVTSIAEDATGVLWVGTRSGGVNTVNRDRGLVRRFGFSSDDPRDLSFHYVSGITVDEIGRVWIGTAGGGLNGVEATDDGIVFRRFDESHGLVDDTIRSLVADGGTLWIATAQGLTRFDMAEEIFFSLDASDGVPTNGFNAGAASAGREFLYFGTSSGVLTIPRRLPLVPPSPAPTVLRSIRTLENRARIEGASWTLDRLDVSYREILSFSFAVLDYGDPRRHRFAYRLRGLRDEWIQLGDRREITFTDLDPGRHTLEIRGRSARGVWSDASTSLELTVVPPYWMTTWFRLGCVALLALTIYGTHKRRTAVLKRRNRDLSALKDEREQALSRIHESQQELTDAYSRLRRLTRRLEQAKEEERKRLARELHDEMGQGLTAAKINLELMASLNASPDVSSRAADTIVVIDELIQRVRNLSLDLRPPLLDELGLRPALRAYLESRAQRSGIEIDTTAMDIPTGLDVETEITAFRVIQEALTNVLRHAGARRVVVSATMRNGLLEIRVIDDGRGFDVDDALARATGGHHLGLLGLRERVEALGGRLQVTSTPGRGAELAVAIPGR